MSRRRRPSSVLLSEAIERDDEDTIRQLIESGAVRINAQLTHVEYSPTPLMHALERNQFDAIYVLLDLGANVNAVDARGRNAVHTLAWYGDEDFLEELDERGAELNAIDNEGKTPLDVALRSCNEVDDFVTRLLRLGVPFDSPRVQFSLATVNTACLQMLIDAGVAVSELRDRGRTPLHAANADFGGDAVMRMLVDVCGVDLNVQDDDGETCCHSAAYFDNFKTLRWLIEAGADIDIVDDNGFTPLHATASPIVSNDGMCVPLLLAAGADVHALCSDGGTPLQYSANVDLDDASDLVVHSMLAMGADLDATIDEDSFSARELLAQRDFVIDPVKIEAERRRIAALRLDLVRERAFQICVGLQSLRLDALQLCEILQHACGRVGPLVAFHQWWAIATTVKHFHRKPKTKTKIRKVKRS